MKELSHIQQSSTSFTIAGRKPVIISDKVFPDCLATEPDHRDVNALLMALNLQPREHIIAINKSIPVRLDGQKYQYDKVNKCIARDDNDNYIPSTDYYSPDQLLELSRTKDIIWFPHPMRHGMGADHVLGYTVLATEIDNLPLQEQWSKVQWLGSLGLPPTSVIFSGNKSLHIVWRLRTRLGLEQTEDYLKSQRALCILVGGDINLATKALKLRLPGVYRPRKDYPQQLIYNTGNSTTIEDVLEVFRQVHGREVTDTLWDNYKQSTSGRIDITPDQVLSTPDHVLKPKTVARTSFKSTKARTTNLVEAINEIDRGVTPEDFTQFGIVLAKKTPRHQFVITPQGGTKGTSNYIYTGKDGVVLLHSQGGDIFPNGKSTINYSTLWKHERGYAHSTYYDFAKAFLEAHNVYIDDAIDDTTTTTTTRRHKKHRAKAASSSTPVTEGNRTTFTARYMPEGITKVVPEGTKVVGMVADCGTGKTTAIKELLKNPDDYIIILTPLQSLARSNAIKLDIYYKDEYSVTCRHISMCLHNLYDGSAVGSQLLPKLRSHTGKIHLVIDEAECLRTGLLALDSTLAKNQLGIIDAIGEIGGLEGATMWLLDKDLKRDTIDFYSDCIRQHAGAEATTPVPHHWIVNEYQNKLRKVVHYPRKNIEAKNATPAIALKHALRAGEDEGIVLIATTGQRNSNTTGTYSAESIANYYRDNGYDGRVLVVDSETTAREGLEADIISDPSGGLRMAYDRGYKFIIFTLGIFKTGISIEDNPDGGNLPALFNSVHIISTGLLSPELTIQSLFRYRNLDVTRYLFTPATGFNYLAKRSMDTVTAISTLRQSEIEKLHSRTLDIACSNRSASKIHWLLDQWAEVVVNHNRSMTDYAGQVSELLYEVADEISSDELDENGFNELLDTGAEVKAALQEIKDDLALVNAIATTEATTITDSTALKLKEQNKKTKAENQQLQKWRVQKVTGRTEIDVEDIYNHNSDYYGASRLLHNASNSYPLLHTLDKIDLLEVVDGNPLRQARKVKQLDADIVRMLLGQGLQAILDVGEVTKDSNEVTTLIANLVDTELLVQHQKTTKKGNISTYYTSTNKLAELVGKKVYRFTTDVVKDLMKVVGATLVLSCTGKTNGKKIRTYKVMSSWVNTAGQCTRTLLEVNTDLHSHWLLNDLCTVATHLEGRKIDRTHIVGFINALLRQDDVDGDYMPLLDVARNNLIRHHFVS